MVLVHKPLPESAVTLPISFVYVVGKNCDETKALAIFLVLPFARNKDMGDFLFLCRWTSTVRLCSCTLYFSCWRIWVGEEVVYHLFFFIFKYSLSFFFCFKWKDKLLRLQIQVLKLVNVSIPPLWPCMSWDNPITWQHTYIPLGVAAFIEEDKGY